MAGWTETLELEREFSHFDTHRAVGPLIVSSPHPVRQGWCNVSSFLETTDTLLNTKQAQMSLMFGCEPLTAFVNGV